LLDLGAGLSVRDALTPIFPGTTSIQLGGTTHRSHLSPLGTRSTPYPLADGRFLHSATLPGARDSGIYVCDPQTRSEQLVVNIPNYAEFDAVPVLVEKARPATLPASAKPQAAGFAKYLVVAGRESDNPERARALKEARFFRVVEAEYTGVTTSSHTNLETRILGTVPIFPDGSAYFEAPADTPIFLDPLDAGGNRVLFKWNYPTTAVAEGTHYPATQMTYMSARAGETRSCYGCHASQTDAVPNTTVLAAKFAPVRISRESTDLQYRRNEPDAYRRQARLGEGAKYRAWLIGTEPVRQARACEMLMYLEDEAGPDAATIAGLLKTESVAVRRAAALALTRLGSETQAAALQAALKDEDWQVRLVAEAALDAIRTESFESWGRQTPTPELLAKVRTELARDMPDVRAIRAAGKLRDAGSVKLLAPWLKKHVQENHAAEAAMALGRIGTPEAVAALWAAVRSEVPIKQVHISRYLQHGPRPEEYALIKALIIARAKLALDDIYLLIALLPNTFTEKPRFEDRLREESQRVLMPRLFLQREGYRRRAVAILIAALKGEQKTGDPIYGQLVKGINLERPFSEHGRPFNLVKSIGGEEALWLLDCLFEPVLDISSAAQRQELEDLVVPFLTSKSPRERIDAAVLLGRVGFGAKGAEALAAEIARPYDFPEITSIGKGMPDFRHRDKCYMVQALAQQIDDVNKLKPFADPKTMFRDIRYGLTHGLARRGKADAIPLLAEMATSDPITLIRQQARYGIADIQDAYRLSGRVPPELKLPADQALEAHYPPRGLKWSDTSFAEFDLHTPQPPSELTSLGRYMEKCLTPGHFRNLNMAQAAGATHMMIAHVEETRRAFDEFARYPEKSAFNTLLTALETPYPFAHYLACKALAERGERAAIPVLVKKLDSYIKSQDSVGYWWTCEALARLKAKEALPTLAKYATKLNPPGFFGPEGMATGYPAARTVARIAADPKHPVVARLLGEENVWLRAGALRGLGEGGAPDMESVLRPAAKEESPALVRHEARMQLNRIKTR
jgi:HEAT repeat protein